MRSGPGALTPLAFIQKWKRTSLNERQAAQEHFLDLCALFEHPTPNSADPHGNFFAFEKGAGKSGGGRGFADVWKKNYFAWEYKRRSGNLDDALLQLVRYAAALENPPLHVVCDMERFRVHTAWTNTVPVVHDIRLDDLLDPTLREILRNVFFAPEKLKPVRTRAAVTAEAADKFSTIALRLQGRGSPEDIAHFVNQLVFCFFAQSVKLLPDNLFTRLLKRAMQKPEQAKNYLDRLFAAMEGGGEFDLTEIARFNGGLFDQRRALRLDEGDIGLLVAADSLDWGMIDPTIFGTLFERFLDPDKRAQIGAHYTDPDKIMKLVDPVLLRPLRAEWEGCKQKIIGLIEGRIKPPMRHTPRRRMSAIEAAEEVHSAFGERLRNLRILDPACGSGNFLYLALQGVKDIEYRANLECEMLGLHPRLPLVGPEIVRGIELNAMAAELARTTIWIGDIQWRLRNGIHSRSIPILRKLDAIETADALVVAAGTDLAPENDARELDTLHLPASPLTASNIEAIWPPAEFILGNPPFLGAKLLRQKLGDGTVEDLFRTFDGRVSREADLVCYWFEKALAAILAGRSKRVGLVSTNSIRGGANRKVLDRIGAQSRIFEAWSDQPWVVDGAAVRVSLVCFGSGDDGLRLDARDVSIINTDLTAGSVNLTRAKRLAENLGVAFMGDTKGGAFDIPGDLARAWLKLPRNPNGRPNSDVLRPWRNGMDVTRRCRDMWIIDFGWEMSEREASLYEAPFHHIAEHVLPERQKNRRDAYRERWWRHVEPRPAFREIVTKHERYLATSRVAKHRIFSWLDQCIVPDSRIFGFTRSDDVFFGIVHSRFHEVWSLGTCSWHGVGNDPTYNSAGVFETFPFPDGLTPDIPAIRYARDPRAIAIADAARRLDVLRNAWLNPADLVIIEPEVVPGYPDRILPRDVVAAAALRERTLTNLYNLNPQWLKNAHADLDAAVARAYGWSYDISEEDVLERLLDLNLSRAVAGASEGGTQSKRKGRDGTRTTKRRSAQGEMLLPIPGGRMHQASDTAVKDARDGTGEKQSADQAAKRRPA